MFCRSCGKQVRAKAVACPGCGVPPLAEKDFCQECGVPTKANQAICVKCGVQLISKSGALGTAGSSQPQRLTCALVAILLGGLGIHKFILGLNREGIILIVLSLCLLIGPFIGVIEGIIYLTKTDEEFDRIYVQGKKAWF